MCGEGFICWVEASNSTNIRYESRISGEHRPLCHCLHSKFSNNSLAITITITITIFQVTAPVADSPALINSRHTRPASLGDSKANMIATLHI